MRGGAFFNGKEGFCPLEGEPKGSQRLLKDGFRTPTPLSPYSRGIRYYQLIYLLHTKKSKTAPMVPT